MKPETLPITALPAWSKLNDVHFLDISASDVSAPPAQPLSSASPADSSTNDNKGFGVLTTRSLTSEDTFDIPTLLTVPHDLILSAEFVEEHAKVDPHFRELLGVCGGKSTRGDVMLFLLMQITIASPHHGLNVGLSNPWSEYCKMLPRSIPVPTMWSEEERVMLVGTSLETAVTAKMSTLLREFETLKELTLNIPWCRTCWWEKQDLSLNDWILTDAWYRSRCLELPLAGESMVPCIDMVNHSADANSYYDQSSSCNATLLLRPNVTLESGSEITISYGAGKSNAEMLFSYGFVDNEAKTQSLTLPIEPFPDDPLGKAKLVAFQEPPTLILSDKEGTCDWKCPFLHFMCLNEEDGLDFKVLQQTDGSRSQLRVFWQGSDVTEDTKTFESLTKDQALKDVFQLRVVALLLDRIREQIERLYESEEEIALLAETSLVESNARSNAMRLRGSERTLLEEAFSAIEMQKGALLEKESVLRYLGSMDDERQVHVDDAETNDEEDFS